MPSWARPRSRPTVSRWTCFSSKHRPAARSGPIPSSARLDTVEMIALRNEVANSVARAVAQPYGAIQIRPVARHRRTVPETLGSYGAVLRFYAYWRSFDREMIEPVRVDLERAADGGARLRRGSRLSVARLFQCLPLPPPDRRLRPGPARPGAFTRHPRFDPTVQEALAHDRARRRADNRSPRFLLRPCSERCW